MVKPVQRKEEIKPPLQIEKTTQNPEFKQKLQEKAAAGSVVPEKRGPGRPVGSVRKESSANTEKPIPPVSESEAAMFAEAMAGICNMFIKKEYKEKLQFTREEFLAITKPMTQLKAYYLPNFGGIYAIWMQFGLTSAALVAAKYKTVREIIHDGKKDHPDNGDKGHGQEHPGEAAAQKPETPANI